MTFIREYRVLRFLMLLTVFLSADLMAAESQNTSVEDEDASKTLKNIVSSAERAVSLVDAEALYRNECAICHGDHGDANTRAKSGLRPPPRNFTTASAAIELSRERMISSVAYGRPGTGMMPHKDRFSPQQIEAVVDYIRDNFMMKPQQSGELLVTHVKGETVYMKYCAVCHGDKGNSAIWTKNGLNPQPRDFGSAQSRAELTRERMINSVANGRPGTAMMPHNKRLTGQEIVEVVDYIRSAFMQEGVPESSTPPTSTSSAPVATIASVSSSQPQMQGNHPQVADSPHAQMQMAPAAEAVRTNPHQGHHGGVGAMPAGMQPAAMPPIVDADMTVAMPKNLIGNAAEGREFYMKNCFECHGVKGDGNGPRAYFNTPRPRDFTSEASVRMLNRERIFTSVREGKVGTVMPAWGKVLTEQQIANVSEFVFKAFVGAAGSANVGDKKKVN
ncbi:MAG: c-type cytochrome [Gammaproteobacteria bacterium]|nr:c-type cytochrome [Gammaproteobacteria bacterium]